MEDKILKIEHICKYFGAQTALDDVSFEINRGEFLSILGPSGCGKTTMLRILIGLLSSDSGTITKDGQDITHAPASKHSMRYTDLPSSTREQP